MGYAGQKCTATKRVIAVGHAADAIRDALVAAVEKLPFGDPADPRTAAGPVISHQARDRVLAAAAGAVSAGGRLLTGGAARPGEGSYVMPTVVEGLPADHELLREEVFGPICAVQRAADVDAAVALANGVRFGLVSAVYTRDLGAALEVSARLDTGMVKVNSPTAGVDFYLPFGGEKASSLGPREQGKAAGDFYTSLHTITVSPAT
jgi:aldehyde dehydrogenase (NAD+)